MGLADHVADGGAGGWDGAYGGDEMRRLRWAEPARHHRLTKRRPAFPYHRDSGPCHGSTDVVNH